MICVERLLNLCWFTTWPEVMEPWLTGLLTMALLELSRLLGQPPLVTDPRSFSRCPKDLTHTAVTGLKEVKAEVLIRWRRKAGDGTRWLSSIFKSYCKRDWSSFVALKSKIRADRITDLSTNGSESRRGKRSGWKVVQSINFPVIR